MSTAPKHHGHDAEPTTLKFTGSALPPQNIEAEQGVLGGILLDDAELHEVAPILKAEDFYRGSHQTIYAAMLELYEAGKPVDFLILAEELTRRGQFADIGGDETLRRILDATPHAAHTKYYAGIVHEKSIKRQVIEGFNAVIRDAYSDETTGPEVVEAAERAAFAVADQEVSAATYSLEQTVQEAMARLAQRGPHGKPAQGISTGLADLDDIMGGFKAPDLIVIGARPSMGKTALALQLADTASTIHKVPSLIVSLEMGRDDLTDRLLCARSRVDNHKIRTGHGLNVRDHQALVKAHDELKPSPVHIDDAAGRSMLQIFAAARRAKLRYGIGLLILDYIQLIDVGITKDNRQEQVAKISRQLKALAREIKIPVIALSQLNRGVENREDRRPRMADLRESGAIEQDADIVLLLHRPEYYDPNDQPGVAEIHVGKNRHGATGAVRLTFLRNIGRFESMATDAQIPVGAF